MPDRPLPSDPMIRALISQARAAQISRRGVLAGAGALSLLPPHTEGDGGPHNLNDYCMCFKKRFAN